jgi:hypothetical protein
MTDVKICEIKTKRKLPTYQTNVDVSPTRTMNNEVMKKVEEMYVLQMELEERGGFTSIKCDLDRELNRIVALTTTRFYNSTEETYIYNLLRSSAVEVERVIYNFISEKKEATIRYSMPSWKWDLYGDMMEMAQELSVMRGPFEECVD